MSTTPNARHAIALEYDGENAPRVSAIGSDALAEQIIVIAREHGVPLLENPALASLLAQLDLGDEIPEMLYRCIAQIIAFAYRLRGRFPDGWVHEDEWEGGSVMDPADEAFPSLPPPGSI
jgi:flagellar biosynthesis protein